jgi:hypothetical protein
VTFIFVIRIKMWEINLKSTTFVNSCILYREQICKLLKLIRQCHNIFDSKFIALKISLWAPMLDNLMKKTGGRKSPDIVLLKNYCMYCSPGPFPCIFEIVPWNFKWFIIQFWYWSPLYNCSEVENLLLKENINTRFSALWYIQDPVILELRSI